MKADSASCVGEMSCPAPFPGLSEKPQPLGNAAAFWAPTSRVSSPVIYPHLRLTWAFMSFYSPVTPLLPKDNIKRLGPNLEKENSKNFLARSIVKLIGYHGWFQSTHQRGQELRPFQRKNSGQQHPAASPGPTKHSDMGHQASISKTLRKQDHVHSLLPSTCHPALAQGNG